MNREFANLEAQSKFQCQQPHSWCLPGTLGVLMPFAFPTASGFVAIPYPVYRSRASNHTSLVVGIGYTRGDFLPCYAMRDPIFDTNG